MDNKIEIVAKTVLEQGREIAEVNFDGADLPDDLEGLISASDRSMSKGSLSFYFASKFLPKESRPDIYLLYRWCRFSDDEIDHLPENSSAALKQKKIDDLMNQTRMGYNGSNEVGDVFKGMGFVLRKHKIPPKYPLDLLQGMADDLSHSVPETIDGLLDYCYKVAGTVGLMFAHIVGVKNEEALLHACQLGIAMQISNICRDVKEDAKMGRCYLPVDLLSRRQLSPPSVGLDASNEKLAVVVSELVELAESFYRESEKGIVALPPQAGLAVLIARSVYSAIGKKVKSRGSKAWVKRIWIRTPFKVALAIKSVIRFLFIYPINRPFYPSKIQHEWRFQCQEL